MSGGGSWRVLAVDSDEERELLAGRGELLQHWLSTWDALRPGEREPFAHPLWVTSWLAHRGIAASPRPRCWVFEDPSAGVVSVLPLRAAALGLGRCRLDNDDDGTVEGASWALPPGKLAEALDALWRTRIDGIGRPAALRLGKVDDSSPWTAAPGARTQPRGKRSTLDVSEGWDALAARLGKNFRGNLRKARNKLQALGGGALSTFTAGPELSRAFDRLQALEEKSWKGREGSTILRNATMRGFLEQAVRGLSERGEVVVHVLHATPSTDSAADAPADWAAQVSLLIDDVLHVVKIAYDESQRQIAPGNLLLQRSIEDDLVSRGVRRVSLVTDQPWHEKWKPEPLPTCFVDWAAPGPAGWRGRLAHRRLKSEIRRHLERAGWRRAGAARAAGHHGRTSRGSS